MTMTQQTELKIKNINSETWENPCGLDGCDFIEFAGRDAEHLHKTFKALGFVLKGKHKTKEIFYYQQGGVKFIVNEEASSFAKDFEEGHGPSACAIALKTVDAKQAFETAVKRGATPYVGSRKDVSGFNAIYGIGNSLVYFVDYNDGVPYEKDFDYNTETTDGFSLRYIDHMTNNVPAAEMQKWCDFYENTFNFKETRFFNIKGKQTGLISKVMSSPCKKLAIPINEPTDPKSQIQEYLDEYKGSGIQHIALGTDDIVTAVSKMREQGIEFLNVPDTYYEDLLTRLPNITENIEDLKRLKILADGDENGYILQIFTKNLFGPIFVEVIQRKNHDGFGEGNFQALFDAIERDQKERGVL